MKANPETLVIFLSASAVLTLLLFVVIFLPRLLKKKESGVEHIEMNTVMGAFNALGGEIKSLKEQLVMKERLAALGEVSAGIAHEFRNPMGVIAGYARLLLKSFDENDSRREVVQGILNEVEGMNSVMEELLRFSRSEPISKTDLDITESIRNIIRGMGDVGQKVDFHFVDPVIIKGDETLLKQAMRNLLQNALDAGDRVWIDAEKASVSGRNGVNISVRDNGKGIPKEDLNKIFMPFYTTKSSGSGIGLALVQKVAIAHGGSISVESEEGKGSTFHLFLPLQ